jgi:hypothetical protein
VTPAGIEHEGKRETAEIIGDSRRSVAETADADPLKSLIPGREIGAIDRSTALWLASLRGWSEDFLDEYERSTQAAAGGAS